MKPLSLGRIRFILFLSSFLFFSPLLHATTWNVTVGAGGGRTFTPSSLTINPGDTVLWTWAGNLHSVTSGTASSPDGLFDSGVHNVPFTFSYTFSSFGTYPYHCSVHGAMMSGTIQVAIIDPTATPSPPQATPTPTATPVPTASPTPPPVATPSPTPIVSAVVQVGPGSDPFGFVPATVSIQPGQTVEWDWLSDFHSVTSGTPDKGPDGLFDSDVQNTNYVFFYTFSTPGSYPYFCLIHGSMMTGTINVQAATPTPSALGISGGVGNCSSPAPTATPPAAPTPPTLPPVPSVTLSLTGSSSATTTTNGSGNYSFSSLTPGGTFTVTPTKAALPPASSSINTTDVIAIQRHFLAITIIPAGCRLTAADATTSGSVNTQDVLAVQRFFLGFSTGTASVGQYRFAPPSRSYAPLNTTQAGQNYQLLVLGDVAVPFSN